MFGSAAVTAGPGNGLFFVNSSLGLDDIRDGTSMTIMAGERSASLGPSTWAGVHPDEAMSGSYYDPSALSQNGRPQLVLGSAHVTINPKPSDTRAFGSAHRGGGHILFADGHARFISDGINAGLFGQLATRAGKEPIKNFEF